MTLLNTILRSILDLLLTPFEGFSPWVGLIVISLLSAVVALLVYKKVSNQDAIERVKSRMQASLFEIRLFNDDLRAILRAQGAFLLANLRYLALNLVPLLWMIVPFLLVFVHLEPRYRNQGFSPDTAALLEVEVAGGEGSSTERPSLELDLPAEIRSDSPAIWLAGARRMAWRLVSDEPAAHVIGVRSGSVTHPKEIRFNDRAELFSAERPAKGLLGQLAQPAEKPLPSDSGLSSITVNYPERSWGTVPWTDIPIAWWFWWLVLMVVFGLALRRPMGVQI
ncbi:MAG: hypothetical protein OES47_04095 [Acidobacteriota bacterium]|nr:hypothetical protein [Acidobacteriota bacterium]